MRRRIATGGTIRIRDGQSIDKHLARIVCRCAECFGKLKLKNNGLGCIANEAHQGIIHRKEAAVLREKAVHSMDNLKEKYQIIDGQIVPINDPFEGKE